MKSKIFVNLVLDGLGLNDLRAFLPAWQEMELASPSSEEAVTQIEADIPIEPIPPRLTMPALGTYFNWTLNQETVFSSALTGKPVRKEEFSQYCWKRCG